MAYDAIRSQLEESLAALQGRLAGIRKDVTQAHSGDSVEQAQERENDEVVDAIGIETVESIKVIQAALERIDDGSYGICSGCAGEIAQARLDAIPEAVECVDCAGRT